MIAGGLPFLRRHDPYDPTFRYRADGLGGLLPAPLGMWGRIAR